MPAISLTRRGWTVIGIVVVILAVAGWGIRAGYFPEIGKFFAAEPAGYGPVCAWFGEPLTSAVPVCCGDFVPISADRMLANDASETTAGDTIGIPERSIAPRRMYCALPGCTATQRQVYCIQAPCPPVVDIVCPPGVVPPPRPSYTPAPTSMGNIWVNDPFAGATVAYGTQLPIRWESGGAAAESPTVDVELVKNDLPGGLFTIAESVPNTGEYIWDTTRILTGAFGQTIDLQQVSGDAFQIKIGIPAATPEEYMYGLSGTFSINTGIPVPSATTGPLYRGIRIDRPLGGDTVVLGDTAYSIAWTTDPVNGEFPAGSIDIMLGRIGAEPGTYIARGVPNQGWFNWDTTQPGWLADGTPVDLTNITTGPDFFIRVVIRGTPMGGESAAFSIIRGPMTSFTPTPRPTPISTPVVYRGVMIGVGNPGRIPAATVVPVVLNIGMGAKFSQPPNPYRVTGLKTVMRLVDGSGRITGYDNSTTFPDVIKKTLSPDGQSLELALGVGSGNGGIVIGNTPFGSVNVEAKVGSAPLCIAVDRLATDIAAEGTNADVFDLNYIGGWESQICLPVSTSKPGDADGNGKVDIFDYNLVVSNFGRPGPTGDLDGNGEVDIFDYNLVVSNFGK